ncbi:MAG: hypothetical protein E7K47_22235 [Acidovorax sp.]|uniref:hypothetical protein n=1 Tax=Diaphorobacter TaxID=238749 RepID=UPI0000DC99E7|nr:MULTISPECIES: hypothetical protein [unclassified Diaphorobacter]ABM40826.1 conserved hypothetical protein [Acidovorax sp. JS42]MDU7590055.1 hypothetical protein [Acidovorax sp.]QJY32257.1 hypothetical protein HND92_04120 [Diaphorobacter sp. JS3050]QPN32890.1 hypothetical protein I3K84_10125 [Diaphorobacter sp. JS3051]QYY26192.1 hypothetical protein K2L43_03120 [Diaphorobacter sp. MNS-0]
MPEAVPPAPVLQRITTAYDPAQDRMRLAGERADGSTLTLWLTQRLLKRLLPALWQWLERHDAPAGAAHSARLPGYHSDAVHGFAQQAARAQLPPQPPVTPHERSPQWLVHSIQLSAGASGVELRFSGEPGTDAPVGLTLAAQPLRQWLSILQQQYHEAEWPTQDWPAWLAAAAGPAAPAGRAMLH